MTSDDDDLAARKAALRRQLKMTRAAIPNEERAARSRACVAQLLALIEPLPATVIAGFWPLPGELGLEPAFARLAARGHTMALPRMQGQARPLTFHVYRPGDPLVSGSFGVQEPSPEAPAVRPRVVLVPLLGFDRRGHRLGYGKGFYDRTLAGLHADDPDLLALGVTFASQEVPLIPTHAGDHPLNAIVTEREIVQVKPASAGCQPPPRS